MRLRLLVEIRAAALADIHTRERQETRWRQNIHTGAAVCPRIHKKALGGMLHEDHGQGCI